MADSLSEQIEIIPNRLYWISSASLPKSKPNSYYICTDEIFPYFPLNEDFGPLNLSMIHNFCDYFSKILASPQYSYQRIYHYSASTFKEKSNSCLLISAFALIILQKSVSEIISKFHSIEFFPFRDAGEGDCTYECTLDHCLHALQKAIRLKWYSFSTFNPTVYNFFEKVENGDMNWIVPNKILAFSCPSAYNTSGFTTKTYAHVFNKFNIGTVIRLNKKKYDENVFKSHGIKHFDLHFPDGSVPNKQIISKFFEICNQENKGIAVHCKAGLGRTGTLIGCFAIKYFKFSAEEFIAWCRICRPGSIIGCQQHFLLEFSKGIKEGRFEKSAYRNDSGQSKRLLSAKIGKERTHQRTLTEF